MLTDITLGQYYPGNSIIHKLDPRAKIIATLLFIAAIFFADSLLSYGVLALFVAVVIGLSRLPVLMVLRSVKPLWIIIVLTLFIHAFTGEGKDVLYQYSFLRLTTEGIIMGIKMSLRLVFLLLISSILTFTTSPIVLTDGIEALLRPFKCIGVPAHELAMMMTIALRFIPTLIEETDRIIKAQTARGADFDSGSLLQRDFDSGSLLQRAKNMLPILVPLFISAFRRADELAIAMEARCYRGGEGRTRMHELAYKAKDFIALAIIILLIAVLAVMRWGLGL